MKLTKLQKFTLIFLLGITFQLSAQSTIKGVVVDSLTKEGLYGANVLLMGTAFGAAADIDGEYKIQKVPAGSYNIRVSYIGYSSQTLNIKVNGKDDLEIYFSLKPQSVDGKEITVTAQMRGQVAAMNQQISSNTMVNVVSADRIRELPDANAAESVGRLPGISLIRGAGEATRVVVRGLEPKLNAITINGIKIPSTSGSDRSVDMSMIASESLEGIEVFKATTPDMDAEAVGGVVNLKIKKAPTEQTIRFKLNPGYNQLKSEFGDYKASGEFSDRFLDNSLGLVSTVNYEKINRSSESWSGAYSVSGLKDPVTGIVPVQGNNISIRNVLEDRKRWGGSLTLDYSLGSGTIWLTNLYSSTSRNPFTVRKNFDPRSSDKIIYTVTDSDIQISGLSNALNGEFHFWGMDFDFVLSRYNIVTDNEYEISLTLEETSPFDQTKLKLDDFNTYIPSAKNSLPDIYLREAFLTPNKTVQTDYTTQFNLKIPINLGSDLTAFIKAGGKYIRTYREHDAFGEGEAQYYLGGSYVAAAKNLNPGIITNSKTGRITIENFINSSTDYLSIVNGEHKLFPVFNRDYVNQWGITQKSTFKVDRNELANNYDVKETVSSAYIMGQLNIGQIITIIPGVRYEASDNWYKSVWTTAYEVYGRSGIQKDTSYTKLYDHLFPHLHLKIKPTDWFDVKFSANKTIARPDYSWLSPYTRFNITNATLDRGNPHLIETKVWNYNLTASVYNNIFGLFSVSGFRKDLQDVSYAKRSVVLKPEEIAALGIPGREGGYQMTSFANSPKAKVWGLEMELQTQLALYPWIPDFLKGVVINANYARIWSETGFPFFDLKSSIVPGSRPPKYVYTYTETERKGPMPGQAEQIVNVAIGYDWDDFSVRLSMLYQGASISGVGVIAEQDTWNNDFTRWDMSLKYRATKWMNVHMNLMNISNQPDRAYYGSETYQTNKYYYGMNANAGIEIVL